MELKTIIYEKEGPIACITFNRPQVLNALNYELLDELGQVIDAISQDDEIRCVIVSGGPKCFAAGADISMLTELDSSEGELFVEKAHLPMDKLANLNKPVIAAIAGLALGGGCEVAMACDIRIAAEGSKLGLPECNLGLFPGGGGTQRLTRLVGNGWAKDMILTGDPIDAQTALNIGLVTRVVPADKLMDEARKLAAKLAAKAPITAGVTKQCLNVAMSSDLATGLKFEKKSFAQIVYTDDFREGTKAFLEKRKPEFKGR